MFRRLHGEGSTEDSNRQHPGGLTRDHVVWAYRLLLDRDPESEDVIGPKLAGSNSTAELRRHLITSEEYQRKNPDFAHTNERTLVIKELEGGVRLFIDLSDHVIGLNILRNQYEADEIQFVRHLLKPGDTAVDAGGHIGFFTMQMASAVGPSGTIYAFEPFDSNAALLERSLLENHFEHRVVFQRAALGAQSGRATLTFPAETLNSGGAYVLRSGTSALAGNLEQEVPLVALDDLPLKRPVRFIKMDVEGAEPLVVAGASRLLKEDHPVILSELHPTQLARASARTADEFLADMRARGYQAHLLAGATLGPPLDHAPAVPLVSVVFT